MAATEPQLYTLMYITADSSLLSEEASVTLNRETGSTPAKTVAKGYSGETPGAPMCELDVGNMIPAVGMEFNAGKYMKTMTPVEMGLLSHGQQLTFKGFIIGDTFKHSVNGDAGYDFKVRGAFADFE
jgi:hypothetical protein